MGNNLLKNIGYLPPNNKTIESFHQNLYLIIKKNVPDISKIICAYCCTMDDKNGNSFGIFFALPDRFVYVAAVPEKEHFIYEEFMIDKISDFKTISNEKHIQSINFKIYNENVIARGFGMVIPSSFIERLKSSEITLIDFSIMPN